MTPGLVWVTEGGTGGFLSCAVDWRHDLGIYRVGRGKYRASCTVCKLGDIVDLNDVTQTVVRPPVPDNEVVAR